MNQSPNASALFDQEKTSNLTTNANCDVLLSASGYGDAQFYFIFVYCTLFTIGLLGNISVIVTLVIEKFRNSSVKLLMMHLVIGDLIVVIIVIPMEVVWNIYYVWPLSQFLCKFLQMLRAFGHYLSSAILVCISIDRYLVLTKPLQYSRTSPKKCRYAIFISWVLCGLLSIPQFLVYSVQSHPDCPEFHQCVPFAFFETVEDLRVYVIFCIVIIYFFPLAVIIFCYGFIIRHIVHHAKELKRLHRCGTVTADSASYSSTHESRDFRHLNQGSNRIILQITRAKKKTILTTLSIVVAFIVCWSPYIYLVLWNQIHESSAANISMLLQDILFVFAVSNSCVNPIVYGSHRKSMRRILKCAF